MKQLKFMLAAATAISLATAAQAAPTDKTLVDEDFNGYTTDQVVTEIEGFSFPYEGKEGDNESAIVAESDGDMALKVNTGTDPLLRALDYNNNTGAQDLDFADEEAAINSVTIDTTVEFTVTPEGDTVAATDDDKLLIYLKEETVDEVKSYALRVMTAEYTPAQSSQRPGQDPVPAAFNRMDVKINNKTIEPNKPYSLQVATKRDDDGVVYFEITLDGTKLQSATSLHPAGLDKFPSRVYEGEKVNTLTYVGFAGEGTVDDLVVTKNYNVPDVTDFTFAITRGEGVSAVAWTIDGVAQESLSASVKPGQMIAITDVTYADWYVASGTYVKDWSTEASEDLTAITVSATKTAAVVDGKVEVTESTKPADVGIKTGSFAADTTPVAELNKVLTWATAKAGAAASAAGALVGQLDFTDETETATEQAYLLNCAPTEDAIKAKKDAFVFSAFTFDENGAPVVTVDPEFAGDVNGRIEIRGATSLDAEDAFTATKKDGDAFFKAFLVK